MDELDELMEATEHIIKNEVAMRVIPKTLLNNPFPTPDFAKPPEPEQHISGMKGIIEFKAIITVSLYPNGKMAARISKPLGANQSFTPRKKIQKKSTIKFGGVKKSTIDLG